MATYAKAKFLRLIIALALVLALCVTVLCACNDETISLTLNLNDGTGKTQTVQIKKGETPQAPVREGYSFAGWTLDEEGNTPVASFDDGLTVYAKWSRLSFEVSFYVANQLISTKTVYYGEEATPPSYNEFKQFIPENYAFDGWTGGDYAQVKQNLTLHADLKSANAEVRFMSEVGGDAYTVARFKGLEGKPVYTPEDPERRGFDFLGWFKADGTKYSENDRFATQTVYYAHWKPSLPAKPSISGLTEIIYGNALNLVSGDARSYLGITYEYAWLKDGALANNGKKLTVERPTAGEHNYSLKITARTNINGYDDSVSNTFSMPVTVKKAKLTATVAPVTVTFGDKITGNFEITYDGFKFDDDKTAISSVFIADTDYIPFNSTPERKYYFNLGFECDNYEVVNENGKTPSSHVTVLKRTLTINDAASKVYDGNAIRKTYDVSWVADLPQDVNFSLTVESLSSSVGAYSMQNGLAIANLQISSKDGKPVARGFNLVLNITANITPAQIKYAAPSPVTYDGNAHSPKLITSVANCDILYSLNGTDYSENSLSFIDAGVYAVHFKISKENYSQVEGSFDYTVQKADVTIVFDNLTVAFGADIPQYSFKTAGINPDKLPNITPVCNYTPSAGAGKYTITCELDNTRNFNFSVQDGVLTVLEEGKAVKPVLVINLNGKLNIVYGDAMPVYTVASVDGLVDGDLFEAVVSGEMTVVCDYQTRPSAGVFTLTINGLTSQKYDIVTHNKLTVAKAELTVSVNDHTPVIYGSPVPDDFSFAASGFRFDDTEALLHGVSVETTYTQSSSAAQQYDILINLHGLELENYNITTVSKRLAVNKAQPSILFDAKDSVLKLNYIGEEYDFKAELSPILTNFDPSASLNLSIPRGKDGGKYEITLSSDETENFLPATANTTVYILSAKIGNALYLLEDALEIGGDILLVGNAFVSEDITIKAGTTLTIPCKEDGTPYFYGTAEYNANNRYLNPKDEKALYILTLKNNVVLTIWGNLIVGGEMGQAGGAFQGHTTGLHGVIDGGENTRIIVESGGVLDCAGGFIVGDSVLTVKDGGTLKHNFVVRDFGGGTATVGGFQKGNISPFSVFDMPNVQVEQTIYRGAEVFAYCDLYASGKHNTTEIKIIANENAFLNLLEGASLGVKHNGAGGTETPLLCVNTFGDVRVGSLKITVDFIVSVTVDMASVFCPLSYIINLNVNGKLFVSNKYKLLPGATLTVSSSGELVFEDGGAVIIYTGDWKDQISVRTDGKPVTGPVPGNETRYPHDKGDAKLTVKGKFTLNGGATLAGAIYGENGATVTIADGTKLSATSKEGVAVRDDSAGGLFGQIWHETASITKNATLMQGDGSKIPATSGTYKYEDGYFIKQ